MYTSTRGTLTMSPATPSCTHTPRTSLHCKASFNIIFPCTTPLPPFPPPSHLPPFAAMIINPPKQIIPTMKQKRPLNLACMPSQRRLNRVRLLIHTNRKMRLLHVRHPGERRPRTHDHEDGGIPKQEGALEEGPDGLLGKRCGGGAHGVDGGLAGEEDGVLDGGR